MFFGSGDEWVLVSVFLGLGNFISAVWWLELEGLVQGHWWDPLWWGELPFLTTWVWSSDRCVWLIPVILVAWLMIWESFDFLLTESEMRTDSAPEFPQQEPTLAVPSFTTWRQECVHLYPQVHAPLSLCSASRVQREGGQNQMYAFPHVTGPWFSRCWALRSSIHDIMVFTCW